MITYGGFRFACEKCIGGHRPATCKHVDRPLKEIRNKGRPSTQCDHCKSRRSEKCGSHVKCVCGIAGQVMRGELRKNIEILFEEAGLSLSFTPDDPGVAGAVKARLEADSNVNLLVVVPSKNAKKEKGARSDASDAASAAGDDGTASLDSVSASNTESYEVRVAFREIRLTDVQNDKEWQMAIENPCSCKLGGTCICSKLPRSAKSRGAKGGEMTAAGAGGEFGVPLAAAEPRRSAKKSRDPGQSSFDPDPAGLGHVPHEADRNWFIVDDGLASGSGYGMAGAPDWQMPQGDGLFAADAGSPFHQGILPTMGWTQAQGGLPHAVSVPQQQQLFYDPSMMMHGLPYNGVGTSPFPSIHGGDLGPWHHVATGSSAAFGSIPAAGVPPGSLHPGVFQPAQAISASVNVDRGIAGLVGSSAAHSAGVQAAEARTTSSCCSSKDVQSAPPTTAVGLGQLQLCACGCYTATGICDSCAGHCEHDKDPLEESHGEDGGCCGAVSSCCGGGTSCACGDGAVDGCAACAGGCACGTGGGSGCCS